MRRLATLGAGVALLISATFVQADQITFKNGNTLTGKVSESDGKTISFDSALAGMVKVKLGDIKNLTTDTPVRLKLTDGTKAEEPLGLAGDGHVMIGGKAVPLTSISSMKTAPAKWTGDLSIGAAIARGNSYSDSVNLAVNASRRTDYDRMTLNGGYSYGRQKDTTTGISSTTVENCFVAGKYDYFLNDQLYLFAAARFDKDRIANLDYRITPSVGLGYQWIERPDLSFNTELGMAYVYEAYQTVPAGAAEDNGGQISARGAYHLVGKFNDKVSYFHDLEIYPSLENFSSFFVTSDAGVRAALTKAMFAQLKFQVDYDSTPATGAQKFNLLYLLGVGWTF